MSQKRRPEVSIVIRAFNEERWLPEVLASISDQRHQGYEIVLVDSGSVDRTREIAAAAGARVLRLRPEDFTFGHSLNVGIEAARGRYVAILSAHAIPTGPEWLTKLVRPFDDDEIAMVFGGQQGHEVSKFSEALDFERIFGPDPKRLTPPDYFANNANSAIRRELWERHPFDEGLPGLEDIEWAKHWMERGRSVQYEPEASIFHVHEESWKQVRRRYHREGIAAHWVGIRDRGDLPREIWRELCWAAADLWAALRQGRVGSLLLEIVRFRWEKTVGTAGGILDGEGITNPVRRQELYFGRSGDAVVIQGPGEAELKERSLPAIKPGEILVRIAYEGICATDLEILDGTLGYYQSGMAEYPIVPGHENSGTVAAVGANVTEFAEGDRVVIECIQGCGECEACRNDTAIVCDDRYEIGVIGHDGGYASYLVARARYAHRVPDDLSLAEAALAEPLAVVIKGLRRLGATPGQPAQRCAVVGAGTIGHLAARVLSERGHDVTVFDREPSRLALLDGEMGTSARLENLERFHCLVEATGDQDVLDAMLRDSGTGATLLLLGLPYARREFSFESIVGFDRSVIGSVGSSGRDFDEALKQLTVIETGPFLGATYPLAEYEKAWEAVRGREHLKVMLTVDPGAVQ